MPTLSFACDSFEPSLLVSFRFLTRQNMWRSIQTPFFDPSIKGLSSLNKHYTCNVDDKWEIESLKFVRLLWDKILQRWNVYICTILLISKVLRYFQRNIILCGIFSLLCFVILIFFILLHFTLCAIICAKKRF